MSDLRSKSSMVKCFCGHEMTRKDWKHQWVCHRCGRTKPIYEAMTNADRIRSMTDEELAEFLEVRLDVASLCENLEDGCWYKCKTHECACNSRKLILEWLKSEERCE